MIYTISLIPIEGEEYLRVLELAGKRIKEKKRDKKEVYKPHKKKIKTRTMKKMEKK
jgi:hypothetical protein